MPRIKPLTEQDRIGRQIKAAIEAGMALAGKRTYQELAAAAGIQYDTICRRMRDPNKFKAGELIRIKRALPGVNFGL